MEYIHYGAKTFDPKKFRPITNEKWIKPKGGLWASPIDAGFHGWKAWCEREQFRECSESDCFRFNLSDFARVLHLRCVEDVNNMPKDPSVDMAMLVAPDFEALIRQGYDAIEIHISECPILYSVMYGWDVDSILVMNPDIVIMKEGCL